MDGSRQPLPSFSEKLQPLGLLPLRPTQIEILQINFGKLCNQTCKHCHVDAGPDRRENMTRDSMERILSILQEEPILTVDITGGAPELNPNFRWFVEQATALGKAVLVRCNLTVILANKKYNDLPIFYAKHKVHVVSPLPHYTKGMTDRQRGDGVFEDSIKALKMLNLVGYGREGTGLILDLVYNPVGAFLPGSQKALQQDFKLALKKDFDIEFNNLFTLTNMPISRYKDWLVQSGNFESYMEKIVNAFNPAAAKGVMCRNTISIGWDGKLYDCDFNQMLEMKLEGVGHINQWDRKFLQNRNILLGQHCYGCTAGSGSSCTGALESP